MTDGAGGRLARKLRTRLGGRTSTPDATGVTPQRDVARPAGRGTPREVPEEHTNLGPVMDAAVARIRRGMLGSGVDADYDLAHEHFDVRHFLQQARHLIDADDVDPLETFLGNGAAAKASPEINFNMRSYLERHPERGKKGRSPYVAWLREGRAAGEIADPAPGPEKMAVVLGMETAELVDELAATRLDLQERLRTGTLGEMFARAAEVEPLIGDLWTATTQPLLPPLVSRHAVDQVSALYAAQEAAGFERARLVLVAADPRWGGGRRVEGHLAHALTVDGIAPRDIVVVYTDAGGAAPAGRFPDGVREIDLAALLADVDRGAAMRALVELVRSFHADAVVNVNSRLLYDAMGVYGKALAATERMFLMMFGNEQLAMGNWVGIPIRFFYRCFDLVEGVITDSDHLADWLRERHQLGDGEAARIHVFRAPVDASTPVAPAPADEPGRRPQVLWAGRWDRQKRLGLALEVARRMPEVDLRVWGEPVLTGARVGDAPDNVSFEGRYARLSDVDLSTADAWLYTAAWDGVPSQLLEVAMTGVPIVSSLVGGIGEVLSDDDAWPVRDHDDADAYVAALREVLADPAAARARSAALRERLLRERTEAAYAAHVGGVLLHADPADAGQAGEESR